MKRRGKALISAALALVMAFGLLAGGTRAVQAEGDSTDSGLQSPVIGESNASGTGAKVTFNFQGTGSETAVDVKGEFSGWQTIDLTKGENDVWAVTREIPAGWYPYGLDADGVWQGDPLNSVRNGSNPGLSVPGMKFNMPDEAAVNSDTEISADYFTGNADEAFPADLSVDQDGISIADGKLVVSADARPGPVQVNATYDGHTGTQTIQVVGQLLQSPVANEDGTVTFNYKSDTEDTLYLVGSMNEWDNKGIPMTKNSDGVFSVTLPLAPNAYPYKFLPTSGSWDGAFVDPLNSLKDSGGNSVANVPGIQIVSDNSVEKGGSITLDAKMIDASGTASDISPDWSLEGSPSGVELADGILSIASDSALEDGASVTVVAQSGGYTSRKQIAVQNKMYTFNLHYYRYDQKMDGWDNWIYNDQMDGTPYAFTGKDDDGFVTAQIKLPYHSISAIERPGDWSSQDLTHSIAAPDGQYEIDAWILEGKESVYYDRDSALAAKADIPVKRYIELKYVRPDKVYTDWNLWVWNTGVKNDQIDFDAVEDGVATARIEIAKNTTSVGFKVRKGDWAQTDVNSDRYIETPLDQTITKVTVTSGQLDIDTVPSVNGPVFNDGGVTFYYRDDELFDNNRMDTITGVKVKVAHGDDVQEHDMAYLADKEYFEYTLPNLQEGAYTYSFLVTRDGKTAEVTDPHHTIDGVSAFDFSIPEVKVNAAVSAQAIDSNENTVLSVQLDGPKGLQYREVDMDLTSLGGAARAPIDQELMQETIGVADSVPAGDKTVTVTAIDSYGNKHTGTVTVTVKPRQSGGALNFDWDEARIYFLLTDRFYDGDASNDDSVDKSQPEAYHGGDFKGLIEKLDYLQDLGINTVWITPIVDNIDFNQGTSFGGTQYAYHGYWAQNFEKLDEHLGDLDTFKQLIDAAHDRGIKIMVDVVLNHAGYGLKSTDTNPSVSAEDKARFDGMLRTDGVDSGTDEVKGELAGLPDFKTEDPSVRAKLIDWQTSWLSKAKTERGDTIDYFRVDTVKNVDGTTWKAFKNALTQIDPDFKLIGEYYGAGIDAQGGALRSGEMDSLLDFDFKSRAEQFVKGSIDDVERDLEHRNSLMDNTATMGQFLSSHDEDGFLTSRVGGDKGMLKVAAALQITAKGQPVIYYGEELGQSGKKGGDFAKGEYSENRDDMPWDKLTDKAATDEQALHAHYQKLLHIRANESKVFSKGTRTEVAGGDSEGYLVFDRAYQGEHVLVGLNTTATPKSATFDVPFNPGQTVADLYNDTVYTVSSNKQVTVTLPGRNDGGTVVLALEEGSPPTAPVHPISDTTAKSDGAATVTIKESDLRNDAANGQISIDVPEPASGNGADTIARIELPANAADLAGSNAIELKSERFSLVLPPEVLSELQALAPSDGLAESRISLTIAAVPSEQAGLLMKRAGDLHHAVIGLAGGFYEFNLAVSTRDGEEKKLTTFKQPIVITLPFDEKADRDLLGVYSITDNGALEYVGGTVWNGRLTAQISHFSKYAALTYDKSFTDVGSSHWAFRDIKTMASKHIANGKTATVFDPDGWITRAEFAALLVRALGLKAADATTHTFTDIAVGSWYAPEVAAAYEAGLTNGQDASHFKPDAKVTREEMAVMITRALKKKGQLSAADEDLLTRYGDGGSVSSWAKEGVQTSLNAKILQGDRNAMLKPGSAATRAEAVTVLNRMMAYADMLND